MRSWALCLVFWLGMGMAWATPGPGKKDTTTVLRADGKGERRQCDGVERVTVYVPFRKFRKMTRTDGVFLTRQQFEALMKVAEASRKRQMFAAPISAILTSSLYEGTANEQYVELRATLKLRVLRKRDWVMLPLSFGSFPMVEARLDGKPALMMSRGGRSVLLVKGKGAHELKVRFKARVDSRPGLSRFSFSIPATPQTDIAFRLAGSSLKATLNGFRYPSSEEGKGWTWLRASVGAQSKISVRWAPKKKTRAARKHLLSAKIVAEHSLKQSVLRSLFTIDVQILQSKTKRVGLKIPPQTKILSVQAGENLRIWRVEKKGSGRRLILEFHKPFDGKLQVLVELERILARKERAFRVPNVHLEGAEWEQGDIAIRGYGQFKLKPIKSEGVTQIDPKEFVSKTRRAMPGVSFTYLKPDYVLMFQIEQIKAHIKAHLTHQVTLREKRFELKTRASFTIERAGIFQLRFALPDGWEFQDVSGPGIQDKYIEQKKNTGRVLRVIFKNQVGGPLRGVQIQPGYLYSTIESLLGTSFLSGLSASQRRLFQQYLSKKNAVEAVGRLFERSSRKVSGPTELTILMRRQRTPLQSESIPLIRALDVKAREEKGVVGLFLPDHMEVQTESLKGLFQVDDLQSLSMVPGRGLALRQAFRYHAHPISGTFRVKQKKTDIESKVWLPVSLRGDGVGVKARIRYTVRYAGTDKVSFAVPTTWSERLQLQTDVRESKKVHKGGMTTYRLLLHRKVPRGQHFDVVFHYQRKWKSPLKVGGQQVFSLPSVQVPGALKQSVYIGLRKDESLSLGTTRSAGFERVDVSDLPSFVDGSQMSRLLRTYEENPKPLEISLKRHQFQPVLSAVVSRMHLDAVATREGRLSVLALMRVQSQGRQFLKIRLPKEARVLALLVGYKHRFRFELDRDGELLIDLSRFANGQSFPIALQYQHPLSDAKVFHKIAGSFSFRGPVVIETPVLRTTMELYLPKKFSYVGFETEMHRQRARRGFWDSLRLTLWGRWDSVGFSGLWNLRKFGGEISRKFPLRGEVHRFSRLSGDVLVEVKARDDWFQSALEYIVFLLIGLMLLWCGRGAEHGMRRLRFASGTFLIFMFLGVLLPESWVTLMDAALLSTCGVSAYWVLAAFHRAVAVVEEKGESAQGTPQAEAPAQDPLEGEGGK